MSSKKRTVQADLESGEAGQRGRDRQPTPATEQSGYTPDPGEVPSPKQVEQASREAGIKPVHDQPDLVHPGPDRDEAETSKGHLHHKQHEPTPDMQNEVEEL